MKVLYITGYGVGGSNVSLSNSITELKKKGMSELVVVPDQTTLHFFEDKGIKCTRIPFKPSIWPVCLTWYHYLTAPFRFCIHRLLNWIALIKLIRLSKCEEPDIIHSNISVLSVGYQLAKITGRPHVFHIREYCDLDFNYNRYPSKLSFNKKLNKSHNIAITNDIFRYYSLEDNNSIVIYNGIMHKKDYEKSSPKENYFLYVGGLSHEKGIDSLIEAFISILRDYKDTKLFICGKGNSLFVNNLNAQIEKEDETVSSNIVFLGQRKDVFELMTKAKALIVPSLSEAFGRITAEAMFNDCLVVGRNTAGTKEQLDNGLEMTGEEIGLRYTTQQELKGIIKMISVADDSAYNHMRKMAFETVNTLYSTEHNAEETYKFYLKILEERRK